MKKIIAREFLILLGTAIIFSIVFFSWAKITDKTNSKRDYYCNSLYDLTENNYNLPYNYQVFDNFNKHINKKPSIDTIAFLKKIKSDNLFRINTFTALRSKNVYPYYNYNYPKPFDYRLSAFNKEIENDSISETIVREISTLRFNCDKSRNAFFSGNYNFEEKATSFGLFFFFIFFILRYLLYAVNWSLKQLKE